MSQSHLEHKIILVQLLVLTRKSFSFFLFFGSNSWIYRNIGAVAELFDISCLTYVPSLFNQITDDVISIWKDAPSSITPQDVINTLSKFNIGVVLGKKELYHT
jgi:hypothetical protein